MGKPIMPPSNYNMEDLYLYCELTTRSELGGSLIDFTGIKTYNLGFIREGLGFGITNINIDISPSMQPVIDITFKDFYGNLAIEFNRNKEFINNAVGGNDFNALNYSSMFELPYPKFKLTIKGYIGNPVALDLNVKRIDVTYQPNDGSYEIKATFIPNLYGFFSDMPFYFLKSINYLKNSNKNINVKTPTLFDILETGYVLEQKQQIIQKNTSKVKDKLLRLHSRLDSIFDDDFDYLEEIGNIDLNEQPITGLDKLYINISQFLKRDKSQISSINVSSPNSKPNRNVMRSSVNWKEKYKDMIIASISKTKKPESELIYLYDDVKKDFSQQLITGQQLLTDALKLCDEYEKTQYTLTNNELLKQVTIETVFDLLVRDSSYLMGRILEAGKKGYDLDQTNRDTNNSIVGYYFPLIQNPSNNEQIPYATTGPESKFINDFISALSKGLAEEERRELNKTTPDIPDNPETQLKKRATNLEIGSQNPYVLTPTAEHFNQNLLERTGLIAHLFMEDISSESDMVSSAISSEMSNINEGLKKLTELELSDITSFCETIKAEIDKDGNLIDSNFINSASKRNIIISRLGSYSKVNPETLKATQIQNNNIFYVYPYEKNSSIINLQRDIYVLFRNKKYKNNNTVSSSVNTPTDKGIWDWIFSTDAEDSTSPYDTDEFKFDKITDNNFDDISSIASAGRLIDFDKMQNELKNPSSFNVKKILYTGISTTEVFNKINDVNDKYFYGKYIDNRRDSNYIWNFADTTDESKLQRYVLVTLCKRIISQINDNQKEKNEREKEIFENASGGDAYNIIYKQFHTLCNNWKNLVSMEGSNNITEHVVNKFCNENNGAANIFYDIPLLAIQGNKNNINVRNSIINVDSLRNSNEQSSVLNIMSNICVKNNFMFLAIPGMADSDGTKDANKITLEKNIIELFKPYTKYINPDSIPAFNHFYVLWMPTPENRVKFNNGNPVYLNFKPEDIQIADGVNIFQIDYGSPTNTVFKSISMSTEDNKMTSESAIAINTMVDPANSRKYKNYDCSALSVMEGRSYKISVEMIGNAQIKPTQFFVLNSTHVFSGLYQIMKVTHTIKPNDMTTKFEAIKMKYTGNNSFMFVPPLTLDGSTTEQPNNNQTDNPSDNVDVDFTDSDGFPIAESTMSNYVGTITHPSIPIPNRALLDTISYLDNGINTTNKGYDVLVGHTPKNPRLIPDWWYPNYDNGFDFDEWKIKINSPTKGKVVTSSAAGRYQIVSTTWKGASKQISTPFTGNVTDSDNPPFNKDNQDIVANFLLMSRLRRSGLDSSDIEKSFFDINKFDLLLKAIQEEWESVKLLRIRGEFKRMSVKDVYDFFVYAYNVYNGN